MDGKLDAGIVASDPQLEPLDGTPLYDEAFLPVVPAPDASTG